MAKRAKSNMSKSQVEIAIEANRPMGGGISFGGANYAAKAYDLSAEGGRDYGGRFSSRATQNSLKAVARGIRKESISKSQNNYNYDATREEAAAQRKARYRDIRAALGLSYT